MGWKRDSHDSAAQTAWQRFDNIEVGDIFAIKGLGGRHDLRVHAIGEVLEIDGKAGLLKLNLRDGPHYSGKAPRGTGAGNWHDSLIPMMRAEDIEQVFGVTRDPDPDSDDGTALQSNLILYGPPGTGKTFALREQFLPRFRGNSQAGHGSADPELLEQMSWFEVTAAALHQLGEPTSVKVLSLHPWIVAKFAVRPFRAPIGKRLWGVLQSHTVEESATVHTSRRSGDLIFDKAEDGGWFLPDGAPEYVREAADALGRTSNVRDRFRFITFHQSYGYEDFIEGIRPRTTDDSEEGGQLSYDLVDGVFLRAVRAAVELTGYDRSVDEFCTDLSPEERADLLENAPPYALFIDEINRGNVARIFGELITLIEPTRRLGEPEELIVTLPASNTRFGVPRNLHLIATMNTADRSVEALDTALRRRFAFQDCPPRPELIDGVIEGNIEPRRMLTTINQRLLKLIDRDHLIGHAYFMPLVEDRSFERLQAIFRDSILPLLQEYFYGDWGRIGLVLGRDFVRLHDHRDVTFADFPHEDAEALSERSTYELADLDQLSSEAFRRIYTDDSNDD